MKLVMQRVKYASVTVKKLQIGKIGKGLLVLLGIANEDSLRDVQQMARKIVHLRIFSDDNGKFNHSVLDIRGGILVVSQFTLIADTAKGHRPSFTNAATPEKAEPLYLQFAEELRVLGVRPVECGKFGADMRVELVNDGPVTIVL
jgi:D-aminoacyl-tRNA deacylase